MAGSILRRAIFITALAISWAVALPIRAIEAAGRWLVDIFDGVVVQRISDLFRSPALAAGVGPGDLPIEPSAWHRNRHEAGIARLGTLRHI